MDAQIDVPVSPLALLPADQLIGRVEDMMRQLVQKNPFRSSAKRQSTVVAAAIYHLQSGGRRIRARLALHAGMALGLSADNAVALAAVAELLHNASLVHDDLQDRDQYRRGVKTVWFSFGDNIAICAGDMLLSAAYGSLSYFSELALLPSLLNLVRAGTFEAICGQCADLSFSSHSDSAEVRDISAYEKIAISKSGALLSLPIELVLVGSGQPQFIGLAKHASEAFAIAYQIADDLHDVEQDTGCGDKGGDSLSDNKRQSPNAILILSACGHGHDSYRLSREIALQHLARANAAAAQLPNGVGTLLQNFVHELRVTLTLSP